MAAVLVAALGGGQLLASAQENRVSNLEAELASLERSVGLADRHHQLAADDRERVDRRLNRAVIAWCGLYARLRAHRVSRSCL